VVEAAAEDFDLGLDVVEPAVDLCKVLLDGGEFASAQCGKGIDKTTCG
jgi:hypothetical protein